MFPFFSVVIPLFNKEKYIRNTLNSVLNQTFTNFEIIIVNDGSTDDSLNKIKIFNDQRIKIIHQENLGLSNARNAGIKKAKAKYIAFLDADDLWTNDFLECCYDLIKTFKNSYAFATNFKSFSEQKKPTLKITNTKYNNTLITDYLSLEKNIYASSSLVCNISVFKSIGFFNDKVNYGEEEDFAIRCFLKHDLAYCNDVKVYRLDGIQNQLTAPNKNSSRVIPDYDVYLKNNTNPNLKKYIDFIHYKLVILYKMELNYELVNFYKKKISVSNLSFVKKVKFYLPIRVFYFLKIIYLWFSRKFA